MKSLIAFGITIVLGFGIWNFISQKNNFNDDVPSYINRDNTTFGYEESPEQIALGKVLFYDKKLSSNNIVSCSSCHKQEFAFSDTSYLSKGHEGGLTGRHSMRLINSRYSFEKKFFWDERAAKLEDQTTKPIQDHIEMGFSNTEGKPGLDSLVRKLQSTSYYPELFKSAFGDEEITESRMQKSIAQFIRTIQSFDSKYDEGRKLAESNRASFPNFSASENRGKALFMLPPNRNGAGCNRCHRAPEFAIGPNVMNNGIIGVAGDSSSTDLNITRAPTLRDLVNPNGFINGSLMHDASKKDIRQVIEHYNSVPDNPKLDRRLKNRGGNLNLTESNIVDLENFLLTLTGNDVYSNEKWASPFTEDDKLDWLQLPSGKSKTILE